MLHRTIVFSAFHWDSHDSLRNISDNMKSHRKIVKLFFSSPPVRDGSYPNAFKMLQLTINYEIMDVITLSVVRTIERIKSVDVEARKKTR